MAGQLVADRSASDAGSSGSGGAADARMPEMTMQAVLGVARQSLLEMRAVMSAARQSLLEATMMLWVVTEMVMGPLREAMARMVHGLVTMFAGASLQATSILPPFCVRVARTRRGPGRRISKKRTACWRGCRGCPVSVVAAEARRLWKQGGPEGHCGARMERVHGSL